MFVLIFSTTLARNISHSKRTERDMIKNVYWSSGKVPFALFVCRILMKHDFFRQTFEIYSNIKFHENPSIGSRDVPCGQIDMTKLKVAIRNFAVAPKTVAVFMHAC